jgi:hypothetical protein
MEWDWPPRARVLEGFGAFCRLIRFEDEVDEEVKELEPAKDTSR